MPLALLFPLQKNAVAVAYVKRGKGEIRLNGEWHLNLFYEAECLERKQQSAGRQEMEQRRWQKMQHALAERTGAKKQRPCASGWRQAGAALLATPPGT